MLLHLIDAQSFELDYVVASNKRKDYIIVIEVKILQSRKI